MTISATVHVISILQEYEVLYEDDSIGTVRYAWITTGLL